MDTFKDILINKIGIKKENYAQLDKVLNKVYLKKNDFLIKASNTCSFIGFVQDGVLRSYIQKDVDEFNIDFYLPNSFVSSYTSFLTQTPTNGYIQALSDTLIYSISYTDYNNLLKNTTDWYMLGKYIADTLFIKKMQKRNFIIDGFSNRTV